MSQKTILAISILVLTAAACQQTAVTNVNSNAAQSNRAVATNSNALAAANNNAASQDSTNHNSVSLTNPSPSSSGAASIAPYDLQFIDTMSEHHASAIEMAKMAVQKSQNTELKNFAEKIIADQTREIGLMKQWREKWFAGKPAAMNMEMPGMANSMRMMGDEMKKLENASGKDFDVLFLALMTPHHEGAIVMSKEALQRAEHPEIKTLATQIIKAQAAEINLMQNWKQKLAN